jgi:hypothetical protein
MTRRLAGIALAAATLLATSASFAGGQARPVVNAALVRRACLGVLIKGTEHPLKTLCQIKDVSGDQLNAWKELRKSQLPDQQAVAAAAALLSDDEWAQLRVSVQEGHETLDVGAFAAAAPAGGVSPLLWGLSEFLVERGKEQLQVAVLARATTYACAPNAFADVLTATCGLLAPSSGSLPAFSALKSAARADLIDLPGSVITFGMKRRSSWPQASQADAAHVARFAGYFAGGLIARKPAMESFARLSTLPLVIGTNIPASPRETPAALLVYAASATVAAMDREPAVIAANWPPKSRGLMLLYAIKAMVLNAANAQPYPWQRTPVNDSPCAPIWCARLAGLGARLQAVETQVAALEALRVKLRDAPDVQKQRPLRVALVDTAVSLIVRLTADVGSDDPAYSKFARTLETARLVASDVATENYGSVVVHAIHLADTLGLMAKLPSNAPRILSFAADVAEATDASGVTAALDNFVGRNTYLYKRAPTTAWYTTINAYAGGLYAREGACNAVRRCENTANVWGAYVPVGVELGHAVTWRGLSWGVRSIGLFGQVIDLGTLASWRMSNPADSVKSEPKVGFSQIFSPGYNLVLGIRGLPLSVSVGQSLTPKLREIKAEGDFDERDAVRRFTVTAGIDIPLFP